MLLLVLGIKEMHHHHPAEVIIIFIILKHYTQTILRSCPKQEHKQNLHFPTHHFKNTLAGQNLLKQSQWFNPNLSLSHIANP